jgi:hypothetical protein
MTVTVRKKDVEAVKAYLRYIERLDEQQKKLLVNDFMRRHVQDVNYAPLISEQALALAKKKGIAPEDLKKIEWPYKSPGSGVPEAIRPLFTDSARGKEGSQKIFHFEHHLPAAQLAALLVELDPAAPDTDSRITGILENCALCIITAEENGKLTQGDGKQSWTKERPEKAYDQLGIKLTPLSKI